ncbi:MAG TPA: glycosyltransferase [Polyangiaceae bacterium]
MPAPERGAAPTPRVAGLHWVGVVVIGRNEKEHLPSCLGSVPAAVRRVVYVDSGSTDGSVELARLLGAEVAPLDDAVPFTAARARNAGIAVLEMEGGIEFILVVDGDCELAPGFVEAALDVMAENPRAAVVCGRRRERRRDASIYHVLCDMEWNTPVGEVEACGGDALLRVAAVNEVGGYNGSIIAGEEPELCLRLRRRGWSVLRIDHEMTKHDARLASFRAWWRRAVRAGHAYAELFAMHGYWRREVASVVVYTVLLPAFALGLGAVTWGAGLGLLSLAYASLCLRVRAHRQRTGDPPRDASLYAMFCVISKFAQLVGMARYLLNRALGRRPAIIEYKGPRKSLGRPEAKPVTT